MEKLKNTPLYIKTLVLLSALLWGSSVMGQTTYTYKNETESVYSGEPTGLESNHTSTCGGPFTVDYSLDITSGTGSAILQWSQDQFNWDNVDGTVSVIDINSTLYLRVSISDLSVGEQVELTLNVTENTDLGIRLITHQHISCHGENDGAITVQAYCGNNTSYTYAWEYTSGDYSSDFANPGNVTSASELSAGNYTITVTDGASNTASITVELTEPDPLSISVNGDSYFCNQGDVKFTVTPSGGNAPYTVSVTDQTDQIVSGPFTYSDLPDDTYTISVVDNKGCAPPPSEEFIVDIDNAIPQFATFPDDQQMLYSDYNTEGNADLQVDVSAFEDNSTINSLTDGNSFDYVVDLSNYENPRMDFVFSVTGTPATGDYVRILYRYNGVDFTQIQEYDQLTTSPLEDVALPLNELPSDNSDVTIRIEADFQTPVSSLSYDFTSFVITADEVFSTSFTISPDETPTCLDDASGCIGSPTFVDDSPVWLCNSGTNKEFYFERTWTIQDNCGKQNARIQKIGVGEYPEIDEPRDTILDYCNYANVVIPVPGYTDNSIIGCGKAVDFKYVLRDETDNVIIEEGTGFTEETTEITFTPSEANDTTFVITWIATDEAGLQDSVKQYVTILKPITIKLTPYKTDFCSGEEVSFEFTIEGGTGSYETVQENDITPSETLSVSGNTYSFTTSSLELGGTETENITIEVIDTNVSDYGTGNYEVIGGCSKQITFENETDFTIHQNISTNALERVD